MSDIKTIQFEIVTPERSVMKEEVTQIIVPTKDGEITVLPNHIPLISSLKPGVLEVKKNNGEVEIISISGGFLEVLKDKVVILADTAERGHEIDEQRAEEARKRAEALMTEAVHKDDVDYAGLSAIIEKELARTRAIKKWRRIKHKDNIS